MKAIKISTDNLMTVVDLAPPLHKSLHEALGGYFEIVHPRGLKAPYIMIVDEEGRLKDLPMNFIGCVLYETHKHSQPIAGDVFIMREDDSPLGGRDIFGLTDDDVDRLMSSLANVVDFMLTERG